jgi:hypothetical protein
VSVESDPLFGPRRNRRGPTVGDARAQAGALVDGLKDISSVLAHANPELKAQLYDELGITVRYDPSTMDRRSSIMSTDRVCNCKCRRGDFNNHEYTSLEDLLGRLTVRLSIAEGLGRHKSEGF